MILFTNVAGDIILQLIEEIDLNAKIYCLFIFFICTYKTILLCTNMFYF